MGAVGVGLVDCHCHLSAPDFDHPSISTWLLFAVTGYWNSSPYPALARLFILPAASQLRAENRLSPGRRPRNSGLLPHAACSSSTGERSKQKPARAHTHDLDDVLEKAKKANVMALVVVAEHSGEFEKIMQLSERYNGFVLPCLGVHPVQGVSPEDQRSVTLKDLDVALPIIESYKDRLLAIGEVGLDFSPRIAGTDEQKEEQRQVLIRQVQLAKRLNLPLNVHSRSAGRPTIILLNEQAPGFPGGAVVGSLPANAGDMGSSPGLGGSRMPRSGWAREPQLLSLRVWSLCSATGEATIVRGLRTAMKSGPHLPQLEEALAQKRRPSTAINK
ncbi:putative deoxyribonuclease TATDN3 isoform X4 [Eschrichtius robustus]|uniref:putative deoxyribonuclease TATDN3 isoform X4 n=1 Tax=Eschrichtius robustus TaxID=9764 RepID=UPI0035C1A4E5